MSKKAANDPMLHTVTTSSGSLNLQSTLSASSACANFETPVPHHPITCSTSLAFYEDGRFGCDHTIVPPDDPRLQHCLDHTIAILLIELVPEVLDRQPASA
jgi:hypothetical protein